MVTDFHVGWLAGIVDGEGTIGIAKSTQNKARLVRYFPSIKVSATSEEMLLEVSRVASHLLEANLKMVPGNYGKGNLKRKFHWGCYARRAVQIVEAIYPHLTVKRQQAEIVMQFYRTPKYAKVDADEDIYRKELRRKIQTLNGGRFL